MTPPTRRRQVLANAALTSAAILGTFCIILTVLAISFGIRPLIFETNSMAPAAPTGSLGIARTVPANTVHPGDIVTVTADNGTRLTHRVVTVGSFAGDSATLTLKGDANNVADPGRYVTTTVDRVYWTVPYLGYVVSWLKNPMTLALEAVALLILLAIAFAPKQGWRNSPAGQRFLAGTAAASVVAVVVSGAQAPGEAQAAPPLSATATGTISTGIPANPTSMGCYNTTTSILLLSYSTVELRWPNPASNSRYTYELSFPGQSQAPVTINAATAPNPAVYKLDQGLLTAIITWLLGGGTITVVLTNTVKNFRSAATVTQLIRPTSPGQDGLLTPAGIRCVTPTSGFAARNEPPSESATSADPSTSASSGESSSSAPSSTATESAGPSSSETLSPISTAPSPPTATPTTTVPKPTLPPGGTTTASGSYAFYQEGGAVMIRDASSTDVVYRGNFPASSSVRWLPQSEQLEVTEPDGTVVVVSQSAGVWTEAVTPPPPPPAEPPPANEQQPTEQPSRAPAEPTLSKPVPVAPSSEQPSE
ncbi:MAG: signal peptidase I [Gordonia sp. (in: high G+C Gram-positive bacteria)]|uniref:signal peptidase I n=1 Tax=Gordonia sp. (in: high G+C Gram-positive bacteria) TaxID=84139 RepID=UPI003C72BA60